MKFRKEDYECRPISRTWAAELVAKWHYAQGGPNTGVAFDGLFRRDGGPCLGAAWWLPPTKPAAKSVTALDWRNVLSLCRLVIAPSVPKNGASFLLGYSVRRLRQGGRWDTLVTYADTRMGHDGGVYRASNWTYLGKTKGDYAWLDEGGRQVARKSTTSRTNDEMEALGYTRSGPWPKHKFVLHLTDQTTRLPR